MPDRVCQRLAQRDLDVEQGGLAEAEGLQHLAHVLAHARKRVHVRLDDHVALPQLLAGCLREFEAFKRRCDRARHPDGGCDRNESRQLEYSRDVSRGAGYHEPAADGSQPMIDPDKQTQSRAVRVYHLAQVEDDVLAPGFEHPVEARPQIGDHRHVEIAGNPHDTRQGSRLVHQLERGHACVIPHSVSSSDRWDLTPSTRIAISSLSSASTYRRTDSSRSRAASRASELRSNDSLTRSSPKNTFPRRASVTPSV